jgi:putative ABC transport system permease protein
MDELRQGTRRVAVGLRQHRFVSGVVISEFALSMTIYVRTAASAESLQNTIRAAVQSVDPNLPVFGVRTMEDVVSDSLASRRFALKLMALFAATALLLAAIGIYGVMAYFVSQRVREIGIRMALGAQRDDVLKMVVWQGMSLALIGVLRGVGASFVVANLLSGLLFGVSAHDPITIIAFAALLVIVALAANYIPAYRDEDRSDGSVEI